MPLVPSVHLRQTILKLKRFFSHKHFQREVLSCTDTWILMPLIVCMLSYLKKYIKSTTMKFYRRPPEDTEKHLMVRKMCITINMWRFYCDSHTEEIYRNISPQLFIVYILILIYPVIVILIFYIIQGQLTTDVKLRTSGRRVGTCCHLHNSVKLSWSQLHGHLRQHTSVLLRLKKALSYS